MASYDEALPAGARIADYEIKSVLGEPGSFGITYRATDVHLHRDVALKEYLPGDYAYRRRDGAVVARDAAREGTFQWGLERFSEEARTLAQFDHRNIVKVLRLISGVNGTAYIVMELVRGRTLEAIVEERGPVDAAQFLPMFARLLDGCAAIHRLGVLHRDIKPANIIVTDGGELVLIDFGAARDLALQKKAGFTAIVTDTYSPPEQYSREQPQGPWTDIYALAATAYFALSGGGPSPSTARAVGDFSPPAATAAAGRAPPQVLKALDWGLELTPKARPQTIEAWAATLAISEAGGPGPGGGRIDRRALIALGGGAAVLGGLGALMAVTAGGGGPSKALEERARPLRVAWTRDLGPVDGDPWAAVAILKSGAAIAARRLMPDQAPRMLALRIGDDGTPGSEWLASEPGSAAQAIVAAGDGGVYVGGDQGGAARIVRLGPDWTPVWSQTYGDGEVRSLLPQPNGLIAAIGTGFEEGRAKLVFVSPSGQQLREISLLDKRDDSVERVAALPDGGLVVLGSRAAASGGVNATQLWVARLDNAFRELWRTQDFGAGSARGWALGVAGDSIFVVGTSSRGGPEDPTHLFTMRLDAADGRKLWTRVEDQVQHGSGRGLALVGDAKRPLAYVAGTGGPQSPQARYAQLRNDGDLAWSELAPAGPRSKAEGAVALAFRGVGDGFAAGFTYDGTSARLTASRLLA